MNGEDSPDKPDIGTLEQQAARLREANEHLVLATIEAQTLRDAAARTIVRQEQFLATLAHELRNPLAPIRTANAILGLAATEPHLQKIHEIIERQVRHMSRLLDDLLDVARMTSGKIKLQRRPVTIRECLEQAIEAGRPLIDEREQRLTLDIPEQAIHVDGDPARLAQVFSNLLNNAAKYTQIGGAIGLAVRVEGESVVVRLSDNGRGISPELLPAVFELFSQAAEAEVAAQGGLGIGLTVVRHMVEMHGGTVVATSPGLGRGSEFVVTLPLLPVAFDRQASSGGKKAPKPRVRSHRITLIDDNADGIASMQMLLQSLGHEVSTASTGSAGLATVRASHAQVVVCDIGLPDIDGYAVASQVREQMKDAPPLLIALTGYGQESDRARALAAGFDHHLVKPVDPQALLRIIETEEGRRRRPPE